MKQYTYSLDQVKESLSKITDLYELKFTTDFGIGINEGEHYYTFAIKQIYKITETDVAITVTAWTYSLIFFKNFKKLIPTIY